MEAVLTTSTCVRSLQYADLGKRKPYTWVNWQADGIFLRFLVGDVLKKIKKQIVLQTIMRSRGGCVLQPCWAGLEGTDGRKARRNSWNLPRNNRIHQGSCRSRGSLDSPQQRDCINSLLMLLVLITARLKWAGDGSSSAGILACRATRVQQNVIFFFNYFFW